MLTVSFSKPKIRLGPASSEAAAEQTVINVKNLVVLGAGVALGVILKQQNEIKTLKRTVTVLQEILR